MKPPRMYTPEAIEAREETKERHRKATKRENLKILLRLSVFFIIYVVFMILLEALTNGI